MKTLAAILAVLSMCGCASARALHRDHSDEEKRRAPATLVICIFARCEVTQETPTPPPIVPPDESAPDPHASRLGPVRGWRGAALTNPDNAEVPCP